MSKIPSLVLHRPWLLLTIFAVVMAGLGALAEPRTASAHVDPPTCTTTGNSIQIATLRDTNDDGIGDTAVGVAVYQGETIYYQTTLSWAGGTNCAIEGGTLNIDPPGADANTDVTPAGGIPCLGGTVAPCVPGVTSVTSDQLAYVVDCGDVLAGFIQVETNWAGGFNHNSAHSPGTASTTDAVQCLVPSTSLTKSADPAEVIVGGTTTYTYEETNDGEVPLTNVSVEDDTCTPVTAVDVTPADGFNDGDANTNGVLDPGETWVFECTSGPLTADTTNVAIAHGTDPIGRDVTWCADESAPPADTFCDQDERAELTVTVSEEPSISIIKTAGDAADGTVLEIQPGDSVTFHYEVCNTGNVPLVNGEVTDDNGTPGDTSDDFTVVLTTTLAPAGETGDCETVDSDPILIENPPVCGETRLNIGTVVAFSDPGGTEVTDSDDAELCTPPSDFEGCTPGYWKQEQHFDSWVGYAPGDSFETVFGVNVTLRGNGRTTFDTPTLLQALDANGGGVNALARHAVAALLNASNPDVDYPFTEAEIIAMVQDAVASGDFDTAHNLLAEANELGCPLN